MYLIELVFALKIKLTTNAYIKKSRKKKNIFFPSSFEQQYRMSSNKKSNRITKRKPRYIQDTCSVTSFSTHKSTDSTWLPPISSLLLSSSPTNTFYFERQHLSYYYTSQVYMPMIPYFFHHKKFGIEACMLQLLQARQTRYHYL